MIDSNNGIELITSDSFRDFIYEKLRFDGLSRGFIDQLFKKLDPAKYDKININNLLTLIFSENKMSLLEYPE